MVSGRAAEEAISQAETLLAGITRLESDLEQAAAKIAVARSEIDQDLAEARAMLVAGDPGGLAPVVARAEAALAAADMSQRPSDGGLPDPLAALRQLDDAGVTLDTGLAAARESQARNQRAAALLDQALLAARSSVAAAGDFINTRRGAVGSEARTRLAEARRHLDAAEATARQDPSTALTEAQQADRMAEESLRLAQSDVSGWSSPYGEPQGGGGLGGGGGIDLGSLVLGGILFGGRGGGWGGGGGWSGGWRRRGRRPGRRLVAGQLRRVRHRWPPRRGRPVLSAVAGTRG